MNMGTQEILLILLIALILFGGAKLPELARSLGKGISEFKKAASGFSDSSYEEPKKDVTKKYGHVIKVDGGRIVVDIGKEHGLRKGMSLMVFDEEEIIHPITGENLGTVERKRTELRVVEVYDKVCEAEVIEYSSPSFTVNEMDRVKVI